MEIDVGRVTAADFSRWIGAAFRVGPEQSGLALTLSEVDTLGGEGTRPGGAFSLTFTGPETPHLSQGLYPLNHPEMDAAEIFLVPMQPPPGSSVYQAVFN